MPVGEIFGSWDHFLHPLTINSEQAARLDPDHDNGFWSNKSVSIGFQWKEFFISLLGFGVLSLPIYLFLTAKRKNEAPARFKEIYFSLIKPGQENDAATVNKVTRVSTKILQAGYEGKGSAEYIKAAHRDNNAQIALDVFDISKDVSDIAVTITEGYGLDIAYQLIRKAYELNLNVISEEREEILEEDEINKYRDTYTPLFFLLNDPSTFIRLTQNPNFNRQAFIEWINNPNPETNDRNKDVYTILHFAATKREVREGGSKNEIDFLVSLGANVNLQDSNDKFTPLHRAAGTCNLPAVKALMDNHADPRLVSKYGKRPAVQAALSNVSDEQTDEKLAVVNYLLKHPSNSDRLTLIQMIILDAVDGETRLKNLQRLFDFGFGKDINQINANGKTALQLAMEEGDLPSVQLLIEQGADPKIYGNKRSPLVQATERVVIGLEDWWPILDFCIEQGADVFEAPAYTDSNSTLYEFLISQRKESTIKILEELYPATMFKYVVEHNTDVLKDLDKSSLSMRDNVRGFTLLQWACLRGDLLAVQYLLLAGDNLCRKFQGTHPILLAAMSRSPNRDALVQLLVNHSTNTQQLTPLHLLLAQRYTEIEHGETVDKTHEKLREIIRVGGDYVSNRNNNFDTPLHYAVIVSLDCVKVLMDNGAQQACAHIQWAVVKAALNDKKDIVEFLLAHETNFSKDTLLHIALNNGTDDEILSLIEKGYNEVNKENTLHQTPLHYAAMRGPELVTALLVNGADIEGGSHSDFTPLALAMENVENHQMEAGNATTKVLIERGADLSKGIHPRRNISVLELDDPEIKQTIEKIYPSSIMRYLFNRKEVRDGIDFEKLVESNISEIDATDTINGRTALHWACRLGNFDAVKVLLKAGANIQLRSKEGRLAISEAANSQHPQKDILVAYMLKKGTKHIGSLMALDGGVISPLHRVSELPIEYTQLLLAKGIDVDGHKKAFKTPLRVALEKDRWDIALLLLQNGANPDAGEKPVRRKRLRMMAIKNNQHDVLALL